VDEDEHAQQRHDGGRPEQEVHARGLIVVDIVVDIFVDIFVAIFVVSTVAVMASPS
jgi:hypothetical protein